MFLELLNLYPYLELDLSFKLIYPMECWRKLLRHLTVTYNSTCLKFNVIFPRIQPILPLYFSFYSAYTVSPSQSPYSVLKSSLLCCLDLAQVDLLVIAINIALGQMLIISHSKYNCHLVLLPVQCHFSQMHSHDVARARILSPMYTFDFVPLLIISQRFPNIYRLKFYFLSGLTKSLPTWSTHALLASSLNLSAPCFCW